MKIILVTIVKKKQNGKNMAQINYSYTMLFLYDVFYVNNKKKI